MSETCLQVQDFLNAILSGAGFDLRASNGKQQSEGCLLDIDGNDASLLLNESGELLEALQHLLNQVFSRALSKDERIICDVQGFRSTRDAELRAMARHAAERVRSSGITFTFGPMNANERRVIHLALSTEKDLYTESIGEGFNRRLKVSLKTSP
jgi:spoIIIJ-associated protein